MACITMPACEDDVDTSTVEIKNANTYKIYDGSNNDFVKGADVSWITEMEANGIKFYDANGTETECMTLLKSLGVNSIRLRVWVDPKDGYCGKEDVVTKAMRANALGLDVMIDFHYSDSWADPSFQTKPAAWQDLSYEDLKTAMADHTTDVLTALKDAGVTPKWVQIGNEVSDGLLWGDGKASTNAVKFGELLNAGISAAKAVFPNILAVIHVPNGWNYNTTSWLMSILNTQKVDYDIMGVSLYPENVIDDYGTKYGTVLDIVQLCIDNIESLAVKYNKNMMVCEFGFSVTNPEMGYTCLHKLIEAGRESSVFAGVFYWEPESYNWNSYNKGAFGSDYKPVRTLEAFSE